MIPITDAVPAPVYPLVGHVRDCGESCGNCDVCRYLAFIEYAKSCAPPGSHIERDHTMEKYLMVTYPAHNNFGQLLPEDN